MLIMMVTLAILAKPGKSTGVWERISTDPDQGSSASKPGKETPNLLKENMV